MGLLGAMQQILPGALIVLVEQATKLPARELAQMPPPIYILPHTGFSSPAD
jgi:hypothetical protein